MTPRRVWQFLFAVWLVFLSGGVHSLFRVGPPGAWQAVRLQMLLDQRRQETDRIREEIERLTAETARLDQSRVALEREIRRVLGYAAADELIFDFSASERQLTAVRSASEAGLKLAARLARPFESGFFDKRPGTRKTVR